jgi:hypothetical protein
MTPDYGMTLQWLKAPLSTPSFAVSARPLNSGREYFAATVAPTQSQNSTGIVWLGESGAGVGLAQIDSLIATAEPVYNAVLLAGRQNCRSARGVG